MTILPQNTQPCALPHQAVTHPEQMTTDALRTQLDELYHLLESTEPELYMRRYGGLDEWHDLVGAAMAEASRIEAILQARRMEAYRAVIAARPVPVRTAEVIIKELGY